MKTAMYTINIKRNKTRQELLRRAEAFFKVVMTIAVVILLLLCGAGIGRVFS